jgi:hypothetical protein
LVRVISFSGSGDMRGSAFAAMSSGTMGIPSESPHAAHLDVLGGEP